MNDKIDGLFAPVLSKSFQITLSEMNPLTDFAVAIFIDKADAFMNDPADREALQELYNRVMREATDLISEVGDIFSDIYRVSDHAFLNTLLDTIEWPQFYRRLREEAFAWNQHLNYTGEEEDLSEDDLEPLPPCPPTRRQTRQNISG